MRWLDRIRARLERAAAEHTSEEAHAVCQASVDFAVAVAAAAEAGCSCNAVRVDERSSLPDRVMVTCWYCKTPWPSYKAWYYRPASGRVRTVVV